MEELSAATGQEDGEGVHAGHAGACGTRVDSSVFHISYSRECHAKLVSRNDQNLAKQRLVLHSFVFREIQNTKTVNLMWPMQYRPALATSCIQIIH